MEYLKNSLDNMSNLQPMSDLSFGTETDLENSHNQKGGFFWSSNHNTSNGGSNDDSDIKLLEAAALKKWEVVKFALENGWVKNPSAQDAKKRTLLHHLVDSDADDETVNKLLSHANVKSFIDLKDDKGDTAMLSAVRLGKHDLAKKLQDAGADKTVKNNEGQSVETETEDVGPETEGDFGDTEIKGNVKAAFGMKKLEERLEETEGDLESVFDKTKGDIENIVSKMIGGPKNLPEESALSVDTLGMGDTAKSSTFALPETEAGTDAPESNFLDRLLGRSKSDLQSDGKGSSLAESTEDFINKLTVKYGEKQTGGSSTRGKRKLKAYVESGFDMDGELDDDSISESDEFVIDDESDDDSEEESKLSRSTELHRLIKSQSDEIHQRVMEKIEKLLKEVYPKKEITDEMVRNIKAVLWSMAKGDTNLDKSIDLEKKTTKAVIKKIDLKKGEKLREESRKKREDRMSERKKERSEKSSDISATSSEDVNVDAIAELSETSFSNATNAFSATSEF